MDGRLISVSRGDGPDVADRRACDELIEVEDVVAGNAENMANAQLVQPIDDGRADYCLRAHRSVFAVDTTQRVKQQAADGRT